MVLSCWLDLTHWLKFSTTCQFCRKEDMRTLRSRCSRLNLLFQNFLLTCSLCFPSHCGLPYRSGRKHTQSHKPIFQKEITCLWGEEGTSIAVGLLSDPLSSQQAISAGPSIIGFLSRLSSQSPFMVLFVPWDDSFSYFFNSCLLYWMQYHTMA